MARKPGQRLRPENVPTKRPTRLSFFEAARRGAKEDVKRSTRTATKKGGLFAGAKAAVKKAVSTRTKRELIQDAMTPLPTTAAAYVGTRLGKVVGKGVQNLKKDRARAGVLKVLKAATPLPLQGDLRAKGLGAAAAEFIGLRTRPAKEKKEPRKQARIRRGP